jgi:integrase
MAFVIHDNGARLRDIKSGFASACRYAGFEAVSPHTLRHTCATWLMQEGVPKWEAAGFLAMTEETLERVYGNHHLDHLRNAADALSRPRNIRGIQQNSAVFHAYRKQKSQ